MAPRRGLGDTLYGFRVRGTDFGVTGIKSVRLRRPDAAVLDLGLPVHARLRRRTARRHLRVRPARHLGKRRRLRVRPSLSARRYRSLLRPVQPEGAAGTARWLAREDAERRWARDDQQSRDDVLPAVRGGADRLPRSGRRHDRLRRDRGRRNRMPAAARAGTTAVVRFSGGGAGLLVGLPARDQRRRHGARIRAVRRGMSRRGSVVHAGPK